MVEPREVMVRAAKAVHREMLQAIDDEMAAIRKSKRPTVLLLTDGFRACDPSGVISYTFRAERCGTWLRSKDAGLLIGEQMVEAFVLDVNSGTVTLVIADDYGPYISTGALHLHSTWALFQMRRRIGEVDRLLRSLPAQRHFNFASALRVIGTGSMSREMLRSTHYLSHSGLLNAEQQEAASRMQSELLTYVWGPPGTGKSQTLVHGILSLISRGRRVLLVASTNLAVDDVLLRIMHELAQGGDVANGSILRAGPSDALTIPHEMRADVYLDEVVARSLSPAATARTDLWRRAVDTCIGRCKLLCTTVHQACFSPLLTSTSWDVLVVDEASMVSPASLYLLAGLSSRQVIAGDFRQLAPIAEAPTPLSRAWLRRDAFEAVGVPDDLDRDDIPPNVVCLREQYRMDARIADLVAEAYNGQLRTSESVRSRDMGPLGSDAVLYVDSSELASRVESVDGSRCNPVHADVLVHVLRRIVTRKLLTNSELERVLVLTPYVAQARALRRALKKEFGPLRPDVRTVHQAEGREADIVIYDTTEASNRSVGDFYVAASRGSNGARLNTVAVTRARRHLVVIADFRHLLQNGAGGNLTQDLLERVVATGRGIRVRATASI